MASRSSGSRPGGRPSAASRYDAIIQQVYPLALDAVTKHEEDGWKLHSEQDGVKIYLKAVPGLTVNYCKGIGVIPGDVETVRAVFAAASVRPVWDEMYEKVSMFATWRTSRRATCVCFTASFPLLLRMARVQGHTVELVDMDTSIGYSSFKAPFPVTGRDFCSIGRTYRSSDGSVLVVYTSVEHPKAPPVKKYVRGKLIFSGLLIRPIDSQSSQVTYALGSDPCTARLVHRSRSRSHPASLLFHPLASPSLPFSSAL